MIEGSMPIQGILSKIMFPNPQNPAPVLGKIGLSFSFKAIFSFRHDRLRGFSRSVERTPFSGMAR
jgi:hypothetical protein